VRGGYVRRWEGVGRCTGTAFLGAFRRGGCRCRRTGRAHLACLDERMMQAGAGGLGWRV